MIRLEVELAELDFIANILAQVTTGNTVQAGMTHLLPKLAEQATAWMKREKDEETLGQLGIEQATQ